MKNKVYIYILFLFNIVVYSQSKKVQLSNSVEVDFIDENRKGTKIIMHIDKPSCFNNSVKDSVIDKVLEDYSNESSYLKNTVRFYNDRIEYETDGGYEKAILDLKNLIKYFKLSSHKIFLNELTSYSKDNEIDEGSIKEYAINTKYPYYSYPFLGKNITSNKLNQISDNYKNSIGENNIRIEVFGKGKEKQAVSALEKIFTQLDLGRVTLECSSIKTEDSFLMYKAFPKISQGVIMYSIFAEDRKFDPDILNNLNQTFGNDNVFFSTYDDFSEIHILQETYDNNAHVLLDKLKLFASNNNLSFDKCGSLIAGDPKIVYESFKGEDIVYLNKKNETISNPFVYKSINLTGKEIVDKYLNNITDRNKLKSIRSIRTQYQVMVNNDTIKGMRVEFLDVLPHKKIRKMIVEDQDVSYNVFDGSRGWINKKGLITDYKKDQIAEALAEESIFPQQFYSPGKISVEGLVIEESENLSGQQYNKIKVSLDEFTVYEYYNPHSGMLMKREFCKESYKPKKTVYYNSYSEVNGLMIPHRLTIIEDNKELKLTLYKHKINSYYESYDFAKVDHFKEPEVVVLNEDELGHPSKAVEITKKQKDEDNKGVKESIDKQNLGTSKTGVKYLVILSKMQTNEGAEIMLERFKKKGFEKAKKVKIDDFYYTVEGVYSVKLEAQKVIDRISDENEEYWILKN